MIKIILLFCSVLNRREAWSQSHFEWPGDVTTYKSNWGVFKYYKDYFCSKIKSNWSDVAVYEVFLFGPERYDMENLALEHNKFRKSSVGLYVLARNSSPSYKVGL